MFINDGIIYDTVDGFSKPYICVNAIWLLSVLEFKHIVIIYRCINFPGHSIIKIDDMEPKRHTLKKCSW